MQANNVIGLVAFGGACFYAGFRYNEFQRKRKAQKLYEATVEILKDDFGKLKKTFDKSSAEIKKRAKETYEGIVERYNDSLHRPELLEALRRDINELLRSITVS